MKSSIHRCTGGGGGGRGVQKIVTKEYNKTRKKGTVLDFLTTPSTTLKRTWPKPQGPPWISNYWTSMSLRLAIYFQDATHDEAQRKLLERRREKRPATSRSNGRSTSSACCFSLFRSSSSSASRSRWCPICTKSSFGNICQQHSYLHVYFYKNPTQKVSLLCYFSATYIHGYFYRIQSHKIHYYFVLETLLSHFHKA